MTNLDGWDNGGLGRAIHVNIASLALLLVISYHFDAGFSDDNSSGPVSEANEIPSGKRQPSPNMPPKFVDQLSLERTAERVGRQ